MRREVEGGDISDGRLGRVERVKMGSNGNHGSIVSIEFIFGGKKNRKVVFMGQLADLSAQNPVFKNSTDSDKGSRLVNINSLAIFEDK